MCLLLIGKVRWWRYILKVAEMKGKKLNYVHKFNHAILKPYDKQASLNIDDLICCKYLT